MNKSTSLLSAPGCRRLVWLAAAVVMAIPVLVLAGWTAQSGWLTAFLPGRAPMRPNAAVGFIFSSLALIFLFVEASHPEVSRGRVRAARVCAGLAGLLGLFTLLEAACEWDPGLDHLLFSTALASLPVAHPGRLPPSVALGFLLLGLALGLLTVRSSRIDGLAQCLLLVVALMGLVALEGHALGVAAIYRVTEPDAVPLPSALLMVVLALGGMAVRPDCGLMADLTGDYPGSAMARRLLPVVVLLPVGLGFLKLAGLSHGYIAGDLGEALLATAYLSILSALVLSSAHSLNRSHAERRLAEEHYRRLAEIVNSCDDAILSKDLDGVITSWNKGAQRLYGYTAEEAVGQSITLLVPPGREEEVNRFLRAVRRGETILRYETLRRRKDGTLVDVSLIISPVQDEAGRINGSCATAHDITDRRQADLQIRASQARLRAALEIGGMGTWVWDLQQGRIEWDESLLKLLGRTDETTTGASVEVFLSFLHPDDRLRVEGALTAAIQEGSDCEVEYRVLRPDQSIRWIVAKGLVERDDQGCPARLVGACVDITAHKRAEESRARLESHLNQAQRLQSLGTLAGGIAHDFNNVLTAIAGNTALAMEDVPPDHPAQESLLRIEEASRRATDLVRRILAFSRQQEARRVVLKPRPVVDEALKLLRATLPAMIEIQAIYAPAAPNISADPTQLHQAIMNLGANAAHAIGDRSGRVDVVLEGIHVDAELAQSSPDLREGDYARLSVTDNGCGMNEATLQRIFEPFFTTKATGQGTGLGLSVVHGIMKIHDGAITVHSRPGAGSTFRLYFPAAKTEPLPPRHNRPPAILGHNENILFVDDEEPLAVLASRMLQRLGYRVSSFTNPQLALERFRAAPAQFDAVVSDCAMPGMTGFDLARELRLIRADLPVVLTTGHVRPQDAEAAQRAGVTHLIPKPNTVEQLGETLDRIFASRRSGAAPAIKSANA